MSVDMADGSPHSVMSLKKKITVVLTCLAVADGVAYGGGPRIEDLMGDVVYLYQVQGSSIATGSGFVVNDETGGFFLVTAAHVASQMGPAAHFVVRSSGTIGKDIILSSAVIPAGIEWQVDS